ncbi:MAG: hypothetical protein PHH08_02150 [Candidatus ainarchaeum sp.]|nr:hypothetical protein [Candidatus ainarchaeum sp.]
MNFAQIDENFFISGMPRVKADFDFLELQGIKKVIFLFRPAGSSEYLLEKKCLAPFGIEVVQVPYEKSIKQLIVDSLGLLENKPCLVHCGVGAASSIVAMAYLIRKGYTPRKAKHEVWKKFGARVILHADDRQALQEIFAERLAAQGKTRRAGLARIRGKASGALETAKHKIRRRPGR